MTAFRIYLIVVWVAFVAFCIAIAPQAGLDLIGPFNEAFAAGDWISAGLADLMSLIVLAALWAGWRNAWSPGGWLMAVLVLLGGSLVLLPYLFILVSREKGDMSRVLLGSHAPAGVGAGS